MSTLKNGVKTGKTTDLRQAAIELHRRFKGKIEVRSKFPINDTLTLSLAYTPGVAEPCRQIASDKEKIYDYTSKAGMVAVVTDGSAVLGLGNIGAAASLPVMEGKAILFKELAGVDAFPICLDTQDVDKIVETISLISCVFGGINLEDISAPRCFQIEEKLKEKVDIPVFHDDQHGTAVVVLAALINALRLVDKDITKVKIVINGAGAAGIAVAKFLRRAGAKGELILCDTKGIIYQGRKEGMNFIKEEISRLTNPEKKKGDLTFALKEADVFIGVSSGGIVNSEMIRKMSPSPIVFAMANPIPEIYPEEAYRAGASIIGTGGSNYPNQINNVLGFPGIFKGALRVRARVINEEMKLAASLALADVVKNDLRKDYILPKPLDHRVVETVAAAVASTARKTKVAKK